MSEEIQNGENAKNVFYGVALCESILAILLILTLLTSKYFFKKPYKEMKKWYRENIMVDTDISQFIEEAKNEV